MDQEKIVTSSLLTYRSEKNGYRYPTVPSKEVCLKDIKNQIVAVNVGALINLHAGMNLVYSNLIIREFDRNIVSWFASIVGISIPLGAGVCGLMVDRYGRRLTTLAVFVPSVLSWFLMYHTRPDQIYIIYFSRFLSGLSGGMGIVSAFYVSELSHAKYRAAFSGLLMFHASLGILVVSALTIFFSWQQTALICCVFFTIVLILCIFYLPESPVWLVKFRSDLDGAKRTLRFLISNDEIFEKEWASLRETARLEVPPQQRSVILFEPSFYKPMKVLLMIFFLQQCTGTYVTMAYVVDIFRRLCPVLGQRYYNEIFLMYGIIRLISTSLGALISVKVDRKALLVWSNVCSFVPCFLTVLIAKLYYVQEAENGANIVEWIVMVLFLCYFFANSIGVVAPWSLNSDLWSTEDRGIGGTITSAFSFLVFFGFSKTFPFAVDETGILFMFQLFGVSSIVLAVYTQIYVPVTLGKSYEEIKQYFVKTNVIV